MNQTSSQHGNGGFTSLLPFLVFIVFYLSLSIWANDFYAVPMPIAFAIASMFAFCMNRTKKLDEKMEIFAKGMGETNIMIMCIIFILAGAFASVAKGMGAVDSAVVLARHLIPQQLMLMGIFVVSCFISLAIGTSCGTIAALTPIAIGLIGSLEINPALMIGAVIGGAMFGDNMSMISDTTIAATRTQGVQMKDKFLTNLKMIIPAAVIALIIYLCLGKGIETTNIPAWTGKDLLKIVPYFMILILALFGVNVLALLFFGNVLAVVIGILLKSFNFFSALKLCADGISGMSETIAVAILAGGLLNIIRHNGGIGYVLNIIEKHVKSTKGCEFGIFLLVALVNCFTANNTVAIVIAGPIAKELSLKYGCSPKRIASILDTASCTIQGLIPYGAQILIAIGIAKTAGLNVSALQLIVFLFYPILIGCALLVSILLSPKKMHSPETLHS